MREPRANLTQMLRATAILMALALVTALPSVSSASGHTATQTAQSQATGQAQAGQPQTAGQTRLRVFLECDCFAEYMREEIEWVDFVRQPQDADVQVLSASNSTGGGGREVVLRFIGVGRLQGVDTELKSISQNNDTEDTRRRQMLRTMTVGLLWYSERAGGGGALKIDIEGASGVQSQTTVKDDPWKAWVFSVRGSGSLDQQESNKEWDWELRTSADRVTEKWIMSFGTNLETNKEEFKLDEDDDEGGGTVKTTRRERGTNWFVGRALGDHWSAAIQGEVSSSTFGNRRLRFVMAPTLEYNIFPYADYASRQLRFQYSAGVERAQYNEVTLFGKNKETNPVHEVEATLEAVQPWGELRVSSEFRQYLHDLSKYRLEVGGELSFRITRGLSLDLDGSASRVRDQIALPARGATDEEILLQLRELQSDYQFDLSFGLTYRFGSIFNNIVNPRFGR
jgi:hypothetical protein